MSALLLPPAKAPIHGADLMPGAFRLEVK